MRHVADISRGGLMRKLLLLTLPLALAGSPAMSAPYTAAGSATGSPDDSRDTQGSVSGGAMGGGGGGGIAIVFGGTFEATATGFNGGLASASASEGVDTIADYAAGLAKGRLCAPFMNVPVNLFCSSYLFCSARKPVT
jgi:hypothetical protein